MFELIKLDVLNWLNGGRRMQIIHTKKIGMMVVVAIASCQCFAAAHYVSLSGANNLPYLTWADAATQIQWAVDVAASGETVWVTNGNYALTNQIVITNGGILKSVNGRNFTFINGNYPAYSNRCFYIDNAASLVDGFTISNAWYTNSTAVWADRLGGGVKICRGTMQNCAILNNYYSDTVNGDRGGGGIALEGSSGIGAIVSNCIISGNRVLSGIGGGGVFLAYHYAKLIDCVVSNNFAVGSGNGFGGGVFAIYTQVDKKIINSVIINNSAKLGGGIFGDDVTITGCAINNNYATGAGGGVVVGASTSVICALVNSTISGNSNAAGEAAVDVRTYGRVVANCVISSNYCGGIGFGFTNSTICSNCTIAGNGAFGVRLYNNAAPCLYNCVVERNNRGMFFDNCGAATASCCTVVSNYTSDKGGGIMITSANVNVKVSNCIIVSNTAAGGNNDIWDATVNNIHSNNVFYSCAGSFPNFSCVGNITNANPRFVDFAGRNYRLDPNSPCVNAGTNQNWMTNAVDMDGRIRIRYGTVDMGAYEVICNGTIYKF